MPCGLRENKSIQILCKVTGLMQIHKTVPFVSTTESSRRTVLFSQQAHSPIYSCIPDILPTPTQYLDPVYLPGELCQMSPTPITPSPFLGADTHPLPRPVTVAPQTPVSPFLPHPILVPSTRNYQSDSSSMCRPQSLQKCRKLLRLVASRRESEELGAWV